MRISVAIVIECHEMRLNGKERRVQCTKMCWLKSFVLGGTTRNRVEKLTF